MNATFELRVPYTCGPKTVFYDLSATATLAHEARNRGSGYGDITITILPTDNPDETWETILDLPIDHAIALRDALSMFIDYLQRNPTPAP